MRKKLLDALNAAKAGIRGGSVPPSEEALASLTPAQRARYDANMAEVAKGRAESEAAQKTWKDQQVLYGPGSPAEMGNEMNQVLFEQGFKAYMKASWKATGPTLAPRKLPGDPAVRTAARAPYRAPDAPAISFTRIATRGRTQLDELCSWLQHSGLAARPDLVHGIFRVPDRISPNITPHSEQGRVVEWTILHHPAPLAPAPDGVEIAFFPREARLIARREGEPRVLDEDVGALYCSLAGIGAEACFGIARVLDFRQAGTGFWDDESSSLYTFIDGAAVLHRPAPGGLAARERMAAEAPMRVGPTELHHELLDWSAIARSPGHMPYLPGTPEELLWAYLEVVGVRAADSYSAACTVTTMQSVDHSYNLFGGNEGPQPCADGKPRRRLRACQHVVLVYRDRPEYVEGRARWKAYQEQVLFARLDHLSGTRTPLVVPRESRLEKWAGRVEAIVNPLDALDYKLSEMGAEKRVPWPYCWPPV